MKKLLIIGAGTHGRVIAEIASEIGFDVISFIDDNSEQAIGKITDVDRFVEYEFALCSIGNNEFRAKIHSNLQKLGFKLPVMVHPKAILSNSVQIGEGTVIGLGAIINSNVRIGRNCIISAGVILDHDTVIGDNVHINAGAICKAGSRIDRFKKIEAGEVIKGF